MLAAGFGGGQMVLHHIKWCTTDKIQVAFVTPLLLRLRFCELRANPIQCFCTKYKPAVHIFIAGDRRQVPVPDLLIHDP